MTDTPSLDLLHQCRGLARIDAARETVFAALPIDGEWITGLGPESLDHVVAMILVPHLTRDDALAYAEDEGCTAGLVATVLG